MRNRFVEDQSDKGTWPATHDESLGFAVIDAIEVAYHQLCPHASDSSTGLIIAGMAQQKYVLIGDPRIPDTGNLWGIEAASSPEEAQTKFEIRIKGFYSSGSKDFQLQRMDVDRLRRIAEKDFAVELF